MWKTDKDIIKDDFNLYTDLVQPRKYICLKCGRVAARKRNLCKPTRL